MSDGTYANPMTDLVDALTLANELAAPYTDANVIIKLMNDGDDHHVMRTRTVLYEVYFKAKWTNLDVLIEPIDCDVDSYPDCYDLSYEMPIIRNKRGGYLKFDIYKSLTMKNIDIDSIDSLAISKILV